MQSSGCTDELLEEDEVPDGVISPRCLHSPTQDNLNLQLSNSTSSQSQNEQKSIDTPTNNSCSGNSGSSNYDQITCIPETPEDMYYNESPIIRTKYFENKAKLGLNSLNQNHFFPTFISQNSSKEIIPGTDSDMLQYLNERENCEKSVRPKRQQTVSTEMNLASQDSFQVNLTGRPNFSYAEKIQQQASKYNYNFPSLTEKRRFVPHFEISQTNDLSNTSEEIVSNVQVIIIQPLSLTTATIEEPVSIGKFFSNDIILNRNLSKSAFAPYGILDTYKNLTRGLLIVKIPKISNVVLSKLLTTNRLGDWEVKCRLPVQEQTTRGVIGPIGIDTSEQDLKEALKVKDANIDIIDVKRISKGPGKERTPTLSVIVVFDGNIMPSCVYLYHQRFKVSAYVAEPWRCYNCQRFGHSASVCKAKPKCVACAGPHKLQECPSKTKGENIISKCANCGGGHSANYGGCAEVKMAKVVEQVRNKQKMSYKDALKAVKEREVKSKEMNRMILHNEMNKRSQASNYSENLIIPRVNDNKVSIQAKKMKDSSTQTENSANQDSLINMSVMMVKLLKINSEMDISKNPARGFEILIKMLGLKVNDSQLANIVEREFNEDGDDECSNNSKKKTKTTEPMKGKKRGSSNIELGDAEDLSESEIQDTYNSHANQRNVKHKHDNNNNKKKGNKWK